jgi:hypothetical protein
MIPKNHSVKAVTPSVIIFIWGPKNYVVRITKMNIKYPSLYAQTQFWCRKALYRVREGNKTNLVKICCMFAEILAF